MATGTVGNGIKAGTKINQGRRSCGEPCTHAHVLNGHGAEMKLPDTCVPSISQGKLKRCFPLLPKGDPANQSSQIESHCCFQASESDVARLIHKNRLSLLCAFTIIFPG